MRSCEVTATAMSVAEQGAQGEGLFRHGEHRGDRTDGLSAPGRQRQHGGHVEESDGRRVRPGGAPGPGDEGHGDRRRGPDRHGAGALAGRVPPGSYACCSPPSSGTRYPVPFKVARSMVAWQRTFT